MATNKEQARKAAQRADWELAKMGYVELREHLLDYRFNFHVEDIEADEYTIKVVEFILADSQPDYADLDEDAKDEVRELLVDDLDFELDEFINEDEDEEDE